MTTAALAVDRAERLAQKLSGVDRLTSGPVLPVADPLKSLFPSAGLRPGTVVAVRDSTTLLLALLAEATSTGTWAAVVGMPELGLLAADELGVALRRVALVPAPADPAAVVAALLDGIPLVAFGYQTEFPTGAKRSLTARARQRGSVLLPFGPWAGADLELRCRTERWRGPECGHGRLTARHVTIRGQGRHSAARERRAELLLPGPGGPVRDTDPGNVHTLGSTPRAAAH